MKRTEMSDEGKGWTKEEPQNNNSRAESIRREIAYASPAE